MDLTDTPSDIGALWRQALDDYLKEAHVDLRDAPQASWDMTTIVKQQDDEVSTFKSWRHNQGRADKIRKLFAQNASIVQKVASHIANAATPAFPPAAAILTAFTYVMDAVKGVSDDYDMVESFFDVMNGFLERLSLLEHRIPPEKPYQVVLVRVFSSILNLSAIARTYRKSGRFSKWVKNLVEHQDSNLKDAYELLQKHLSRLESMTLMATLKQTMVISRDVSSLGSAVGSLGTKMDLNLKLTQQGLSIGLDTKAYAERAALAALEGKELNELALDAIRQQGQDVKNIANLFKQQQLRDDKKGPQAGLPKASAESKDSGAKKTLAIKDIRAYLRCQQYSTRVYQEETDIMAAYVPGTMHWIQNVQSYQDLFERKTQALLITGPPGMGKSTLSSHIVRILDEAFREDASVSVCRFYIREDHEQMRDIEYIMRACALQAALKDPQYRDHLRGDFQKHGLLEQGNTEKWFSRLFTKRYPRDSERRVIIVLDGLDELTDSDVRVVNEMLSLVTSSEANIQFILTGRSMPLSEHEGLRSGNLDIDKDTVRKDMWKIALARARSMPQLRKLRLEVRRKVAKRLRQEADNIRYIDHMMRKLNTLGAREGLILKELDHLPKNTQELYEAVLEENQRYRTPKEKKALKIFFAWLAYSKQQIRLGEADKILQIIAADSGINIDEELGGRSARILRLAESPIACGPEPEPSDAEDDLEGDDEMEAREDISVLLGFQERTLRAYFRSSTSDKNSLRSSPSDANTMIFETICRAFLTLKDNPDPDKEPSELGILEYGAKYWKDHLKEIDMDSLNDDEMRSVVENLYVILHNQNNSMKKIEEFCGEESNTPSIFGPTEESSVETLAVIRRWAEKALRLPTAGGQFFMIQEWFRPLAQNLSRIWISNARSHINNWLKTSEHQEQASRSFRYAHEALRRGYHCQELPELKQNENTRKLCQYFESFALAPPSEKQTFTEEAILTVSNAFWDIPKSYRSYWAIALAMKWENLYEPALVQTRIAMSHSSTESERYPLYDSIGDTLLHLYQDPPQGGEPNLAYVTEACETYSKAVAFRCADSVTSQDDFHTQDRCADIYLQYATAEYLRGDVEKMRALVCEATKVPGVFLFIADLLDPITNAQDWSLALDVLQLAPVFDRSWYLTCAVETIYTEIQRESVRRGQHDEIVRVYAEGMESIMRERLGCNIGLQLADYHQMVRGDHGAAKEVLRRLLDYVETAGKMPFGPFPQTVIWRIVDNLMEEFRRATNPAKKVSALDELKVMLLRLQYNAGEDFEPSQSETTIPLALMTRKLGPAIQFQEIMQKAFDGCIANLSDNTGTNDSSSFRLLSKVLSCIEGLEKEASISLSCQFYIMDMEIHKRDIAASPQLSDDLELESQYDIYDSPMSEPEFSSISDVISENRTSITSIASITSRLHSEAESMPLSERAGNSHNGISHLDEHTFEPAAPQNIEQKEDHTFSDGTQDALPPVTVGTDSEQDESKASQGQDEDLDADTYFICNECESPIHDWKAQHAYYCLHCTDVDLCEACFTKRLQREKGELPPAWRTVCPVGHKHIKAPVEGWKGVKGGVISIGDEKVVFSDWLKELRDIKWPKAWDNFWAEELA